MIATEQITTLSQKEKNKIFQLFGNNWRSRKNISSKKTQRIKSTRKTSRQLISYY